MSLELLDHLQRQHAFDPSPRREDLGVYHVPFGELVTGNAAEASLEEAVRSVERIAVVGGSGQGKSSLISHVLGPLAEGVAPIVVPVAAEPAAVILEPKAFAEHVVQIIADYAADEAQLIKGSRRDALLRESSPTRSTAPAWERGRAAGKVPWLGAELALEVRRQVTADPHVRSASAVFEVIDQVLIMIGRQELVPALIFDDTDKWLRSVYADPAPLVAAFFGKVLPIVRELRCALVVAVHREYLADGAHRKLIGRALERKITLPELGDPRALGRVIQSRVKIHTGAWTGPAELGDVLTPPAVQRLFEHYTQSFRGELRTVLRTVHGALTEACDDRLPAITPELIDNAVAAW